MVIIKTLYQYLQEQLQEELFHRIRIIGEHSGGCAYIVVTSVDDTKHTIINLENSIVIARNIKNGLWWQGLPGKLLKFNKSDTEGKTAFQYKTSLPIDYDLNNPNSLQKLIKDLKDHLNDHPQDHQETSITSIEEETILRHNG